MINPVSQTEQEGSEITLGFFFLGGVSHARVNRAIHPIIFLSHFQEPLIREEGD